MKKVLFRLLLIGSDYFVVKTAIPPRFSAKKLAAWPKGEMYSGDLNSVCACVWERERDMGIWCTVGIWIVKNIPVYKHTHTHTHISPFGLSASALIIVNTTFRHSPSNYNLIGIQYISTVNHKSKSND